MAVRARCAQAMRNFQRLQVAAAALGALCLLALSTVLGRGAPVMSAAPLGLTAGVHLPLIPASLSVGMMPHHAGIDLVLLESALSCFCLSHL